MIPLLFENNYIAHEPLNEELDTISSSSDRNLEVTLTRFLSLKYFPRVPAVADGYTTVWGIQGAHPSVHAQEQDEHRKRHQRSGAR